MPSVPPVTCALPSRVEGFKGREDERRKTSVAVKGGQAAAIYDVAGIGKTALATQIAHELREENAFPEGIVFVELGPHGAVLPTMDRVAECLGNAAFRECPAERKPFLFSQLLTERRVLVIYDNLWSQELGNDLIRHRGTSPVIITGRSPMGLDLGTVVELEALEPEEARALFKAHARIQEGEDQHDGAVDGICGILKNHPLAVKVAGKNCFTYKLSSEQMLERLREGNVITALEMREEGESLVRSFSISYKLMDEEERALFRSLGVFGGATISEGAISAVYGGDESEEKLRRLMDVALLDRDASTGRYIVHDLLREYARLLLEEDQGERDEGRKRIVSFFLQGTESAYEEWETEKHQEALSWYSAEMEHLREARRWALEGADKPTVVELAHSAVPYVRSIGLWGEAVAWGEDALGVAEDLGDSSLISGACLSLGKTFKDKGGYGSALDMYKKGLEHAETAHGEESGEVANFLNNVGTVLSVQGKPGQALEYHEKALAINRKIFGEEHWRIGADYNNIALVLQDQGKLDEALENHRGALAIKEKVLGEEHPSTATSYNNIGSVLSAQGKLDEALEHYRKALAIDEKVLGKDHPGTAIDYNNIGAVLHDQGKLDEALEYHEKALLINRTVFGEEHPSTAASYNNIGGVLQDQGKLDEALENLERAHAICLKVYGPDHERTKATKEWMDDVRKRLGKQ